MSADRLNIDVRLKLKKYQAGLKTMTAEGRRAAGKLDQSFSGADNSINQLDSSINKTKGSTLAFKLSAAALATTITTGLVVATKQMINVGSDFTAVMSNLKAISGATDEEMQSLEKTALDLGRSTKFTSSEVGNLQVAYSKLGFSADEINKVTSATLALAAATGEDLATSAQVAGGTLRSFGLDASETSRITDVMTSSFSNSALDLQKFKVAIGQSGKVSADAGLEIENTASILGVLADNNLRAETTGTGLRNILLKLNESGSKSAEILGGQVNSFDDFIERLKVARDDQDAFKEAQKEFGLENAVVFSTLVSNIDKLQEKSELYYNAAGTAQEKMLTQMDNLTGDTAELRSAMEGLYIQVFKDTEPALRKLTQTTTDFFLKLQETQLETTIRQLKELGIEAKELQKTVDLKNALDVLKDSGDDIEKSLGKVFKVSTGMIGSNRELWGMLGQEMGDYGREIDESAVKTENVETAIKDITQKIFDLKDGKEKLNRSDRAQLKVYTKTLGALQQLRVEAEKRNNAEITLQRLKEDNNKTEEQRAQEYRRRHVDEVEAERKRNEQRTSTYQAQNQAQINTVNNLTTSNELRTQEEQVEARILAYIEKQNALQNKATQQLNSILSLTGQLSGDMFYSALYAEKFGENMKRSLLQIASTLAAKAAQFAILTAISGGSGGLAAAATKALKSFSFFDSGGYTGNAPRNQVTGAVHGQEFVFDAQSTQAIGANNLNSLMNNPELLSKPTFAIAGNTGSDASTKEMISLLKQINAKQMTANVTMDGKEIPVSFKIKGRDLVGLIDKTNASRMGN